MLCTVYVVGLALLVIPLEAYHDPEECCSRSYLRKILAQLSEILNHLNHENGHLNHNKFKQNLHDLARYLNKLPDSPESLHLKEKLNEFGIVENVDNAAAERQNHYHHHHHQHHNSIITMPEINNFPSSANKVNNKLPNTEAFKEVAEKIAKLIDEMHNAKDSDSEYSTTTSNPSLDAFWSENSPEKDTEDTKNSDGTKLASSVLDTTNSGNSVALGATPLLPIKSKTTHENIAHKVSEQLYRNPSKLHPVPDLKNHHYIYEEKYQIDAHPFFHQQKNYIHPINDNDPNEHKYFDHVSPQDTNSLLLIMPVRYSSGLSKLGSDWLQNHSAEDLPPNLSDILSCLSKKTKISDMDEENNFYYFDSGEVTVRLGNQQINNELKKNKMPNPDTLQKGFEEWTPKNGMQKPRHYDIRIESFIYYGLQGAKIDTDDLRDHLYSIKEFNPQKQRKASLDEIEAPFYKWKPGPGIKKPRYPDFDIEMYIYYNIAGSKLNPDDFRDYLYTAKAQKERLDEYEQAKPSENTTKSPLPTNTTKSPLPKNIPKKPPQNNKKKRNNSEWMINFIISKFYSKLSKKDQIKFRNKLLTQKLGLMKKMPDANKLKKEDNIKLYNKQRG